MIVALKQYRQADLCKRSQAGQNYTVRTCLNKTTTTPKNQNRMFSGFMSECTHVSWILRVTGG